MTSHAQRETTRVEASHPSNTHRYSLICARQIDRSFWCRMLRYRGIDRLDVVYHLLSLAQRLRPQRTVYRLETSSKSHSFRSLSLETSESRSIAYIGMYGT